MILDINCKSKREAADAALISMSATIHLDLTKLNICFNEVAVHYKNLEEINVYISMKYYEIYQFNFNLYMFDAKLVNGVQEGADRSFYVDHYLVSISSIHNSVTIVENLGFILRKDEIDLSSGKLSSTCIEDELSTGASVSTRIRSNGKALTNSCFYKKKYFNLIYEDTLRLSRLAKNIHRESTCQDLCLKLT
uniref:Uncharacterized protein n=1 Tax=Schistosoma haematobium TaxID=6185 RepID=A0A094ZN29_SCHHA